MIQVVEAVPLSWWRYVVPTTEFVVTYHVISNKWLPHVGHLYSYKKPEEFNLDLEFLERHCVVCDYRKFVSLRSAPSLSRRPLAIVCFDDGLSTDIEETHEGLARRNLKAVFFIATDFIGNRKMMFRHKASLCVEALLDHGEVPPVLTERIGDHLGVEVTDPGHAAGLILALRSSDQPLLNEVCEHLGVDWREYLRRTRPYFSEDELKWLANEGHEIGAHTLSHRAMVDMSPGEIEREIVESCQRISEISGREEVPFAFPFGCPGPIADLYELKSNPDNSLGLIFSGSQVPRSDAFVLRAAADRPSESNRSRSNLENVWKLSSARRAGGLVRSKIGLPFSHSFSKSPLTRS